MSKSEVKLRVQKLEAAGGSIGKHCGVVDEVGGTFSLDGIKFESLAALEAYVKGLPKGDRVFVLEIVDNEGQREWSWKEYA